MHRVYASHAQGGELTYEALGNNRYRVTARYFRDCSGIAPETSLTLNCRVGTPTTSCTGNDPRNQTVTLVRGTLTNGSPYCPSVPGGPDQCTANGLTNYQTALYTGEVTLAPAPEWTLSVEINARPSLSNVPGNTTLRFEATLNNQLTVGSSTQVIQNTSPQYQLQDIPVPFVCRGQRTTLTFSTLDRDGDSLVYSLARPLDGCNLPSTYSSLTTTGGVILAPEHTTANPCVITLPSGTTAYTSNFPISSYNFTGSCPVKTATPYFNFDAQAGSFTFTPAVFDNRDPAKNKYVVVGKVTEYRRINGRYHLVGSVRRDMLVVIIDCGGNTVPNAPVAQPVVIGQNTVITNTDSTIISAQACEYTEVSVNFRDPNPGDNLTVTFSEPTNLDYPDLYTDLTDPTAKPFVLRNNGTNTPSALVRLRPDPLQVGHVYRIAVRIEDNACPIKAVQNRIIVIRVIRRSVADVTITGTNPTRGTTFRRDSLITKGEAISLTARPNRPSVVGTSPVTYTYAWRASTPSDVSGLTSDQLTNEKITVEPKQTTRYSVTITPTRFFRSNACQDTASFVIRVAPQVPNVFTPNGDGLNDFFVVKDLSQPARRLEVFNRWGRKIGDWADYQNNWDGSGQSAGVYYYQITLADGSRRKGWVEIVR